MRVIVQRDGRLTPEALRAVRSAGIARLLRRSGDTLGVPAQASVVVRCTDDIELRRLNRQYAGVDAATDVLAFGGDGAHIGDVAISVEHALAQSADGPAELRLLAVHGLLHCLGQDHADDAGAQAMTRWTRRLLPDQTVPALRPH